MYSSEVDYRRADGFGVRATVSHALDDIEQLQPGFGPAEFDYARTARTNVDVQLDLARIGTHAFSFGLQRSDENTRAQSFGTVFDEDTAVTQAFVQDQFDDRPPHLAGSRWAAWITKPSAASSPGTRNSAPRSAPARE